MHQRNIPWKAEWKAAGLDPGPLSPEESALVPTLEDENRAFLERHPWQAPPVKRQPPRLALWSVPLAAAALLLIATLPLVPAGSAQGQERIKGSGTPALMVYRQSAGQPERLSPQAVVKPGDVIQASYQVTKAEQGALASVDGNGQVTVHLGSQGHSVALAPGGEKFLDTSYELDQAPRYEVFFLLTSDKPFDLGPVVQILRQTPWSSLAPGAFGRDIRFDILPLNKAAAK
jgi:hypothetical protein